MLKDVPSTEILTLILQVTKWSKEQVKKPQEVGEPKAKTVSESQTSVGNSQEEPCTAFYQEPETTVKESKAALSNPQT